MKQGSPALSVAILFGASYLAYAQGPPVNHDAQITADFESRVRRYVKIHQEAESRLKLPALKPTANPVLDKLNRLETTCRVEPNAGIVTDAGLFVPAAFVPSSAFAVIDTV